jgi:hypothetical protein
MSRARFGFMVLAAIMAVPGGRLLADVGPEVAKVREARVRANEKGNASEFAGKWRMTLPAGFKYEVQLTQRDDGLLKLECPGHDLNLLGDFVCIGNELRLVNPRKERVDDYIWVYRDGRFVLTQDQQHHGGHYLGATLTRLP